MNNRIIQIGALAVWLFAGGCSNESCLVSEPTVRGEITIQTRADEVGEYRLLAFNAGNGICALNQIIKADGAATTLSLAGGNYKFVTLTGASQFDLPEAGTTDGLSLSGAITLKTDQSLKSCKISKVEEISIPAASVYAAELVPATCLVTLTMVNEAMLPSGQTFACILKNMYNGICPDGSTPGTTLSAGYKLSTEKETICFPTNGNAVLTCQIGTGAVQELVLNKTFIAGMSYTVTLTYKGSFALKDLEIKEWGGVGNEHDGDAEIP
ncbi:hypothetical protein HMPREF1212_02024 [Parabacteroides sp. HGS0025]|uniref:hypothetical protein n=1 Tax=Parabacteroides sp. HGS0025 TaxID=1078087 RepID=UPI00061728E8|nr:hypothetical protein [Parabacteroides sp. HGS0025]KKB51294.1 hypothetical protein HMPREF1212_02024 [Parabacteroides sp. HGS0025]